MPKMKTHRGAAKRFKTTGSGKLRRRRAFRNHILEKKPSTVKRRLKDEGTSFNALREDVRRELATRYLDADMSIAEISFLLGFSEPSAFFRAFKRWTGLTPLEARRRHALAP